MTRLRDHLVQLIQANGPLGIADFMRLALSAPDVGYYNRGDPLGAGGDFTTAPEISQIFGELIGLWGVAIWEALGSPAKFSLVELGPGRGTLMSDALRAARIRPAFLEAAEVVLVEISATLRERQRAALKDVRLRDLKWVERFEELGAGQPIVLIANEFFDALPVRQFVATARGWRERCVALSAEGALTFAPSPETAPEGMIPFDVASVHDGAVVELAPLRNALAATIAARLKADGGAALIIDYGFAGPAVGDTLQAMKAHRFVPVLDEPGHADLTAHVDFAALAAGFAAGGADVYGALEQSAFLQRLGARERVETLSSRATIEDRASLEAGLARLTGPEQMGSLFKTLVATSPGLLPPGFALHERR